MIFSVVGCKSFSSSSGLLRFNIESFFLTKTNCMKRYFSGLLLAVASLLVLNACKKPSRTTAEPAVPDAAHLVPESFARALARHISPNHFGHASWSHGAARSAEEGTPGGNWIGDIVDRDVEEVIAVKDENDEVALYVYNYVDGGALVLSADFRHEPVCAYIERGRLTSDDQAPSGVVNWFQKTIENIQLLRRGEVENTLNAAAAWKDLVGQIDINRYPEVAKTMPPQLWGGLDTEGGCYVYTYYNAVGPLLPTAWGQGCTFNSRMASGCSSNCGHQVTGCVPTAMAQVIRYWQPRSAYNYNYSSMPLQSGNDEVARLMQNCGEVVGLNPGCESSGADPDRVPGALYRFGLASSPHNPYNGSSSYIRVQDNIRLHRPVLLDGCSVTPCGGFLCFRVSCHEWVCDGYESSGNSCYGYLRFHMNWGWNTPGASTDFNGWFSFDTWASALGTYSYARGYVYDIVPR